MCPAGIVGVGELVAQQLAAEPARIVAGTAAEDRHVDRATLGDTEKTSH